MSKFSLPAGLVGSDILNLITVGMHSNPLCIYREYIQNAADSIAVSNNKRKGKVEIHINQTTRRIKIKDNGQGISTTQLARNLLPIANSRKQPGADRGFRGIGRLSGLAFADSVTFLTRSTNKEPVARVKWNKADLQKGVADGKPMKKLIGQSTTVDTIPGNEYPDSFFQVEIDNIARFATGLILNCDVVRDYISEVCPVPFSPNFPYASEVLNLFNKKQAPLTLDVFLNDENSPLTRNHGDVICFSNDRHDGLLDFEKIVIPAIDGDGHAAIGWIAHSSYIGAIPKKSGVRCIRARVGNIQIGDETLFDHLFTESRFNRWCIAEIHILDPRIIPNGKRDYFEPNHHVRNLENHLGVISRKIEQQCRNASRERNKTRKSQLLLKDIEATYELASSGYLSANATRELISEKLLAINEVQEKIVALEKGKEGVAKLEQLKKKLSGFKARRGRPSFVGIPAREVETYRKFFHILAKISSSPSAAMKTIKAVLEQAERKKSNKPNKD